MTQLPAGLMDCNVEFFVDGRYSPNALTNGVVVSFENFNNEWLYLLEEAITNDPKKSQELTKMGLTITNDRIRQFLVCNYGKFDHHPDIANGKLQETEYCKCPKRGTCPHEGVLCDGLKTTTGEFLTAREIEYTRLTAEGHLDKTIAAMLNISLLTVTTHSRNARRKTGSFRKQDLTRFAIQNQLI